jgi:hypothetical protein
MRRGARHYIPIATPGEGGDNHLTNPYFNGTHGAHPPSPWMADTPDGQADNGWDVSFKPTNPSPTNTACRLNDPAQSGLSGPNRDEKIWQVVAGHGANLVVEGQCVHHFAEYTDIKIYGSANSNGPWSEVWHPFDLDDSDATGRWAQPVKHFETTIGQSYAWYKFEFSAMFPEAGPSDDAGGVKFTNALFWSG